MAFVEIRSPCRRAMMCAPELDTFPTPAEKLRGARWSEDATQDACRLIGIGWSNKRRFVAVIEGNEIRQDGVCKRGNLNGLGGCRWSLMVLLTMGTRASRTKRGLALVIGRYLHLCQFVIEHLGPMQVVTACRPRRIGPTRQNSNQAQRQQAAAREPSTRR